MSSVSISQLFMKNKEAVTEWSHHSAAPAVRGVTSSGAAPSVCLEQRGPGPCLMAASLAERREAAGFVSSVWTS